MSQLNSEGSIFISILSSARGYTNTDANEVCLLALESNGDILTNLWTPFSLFKYPKEKSPSNSKVTDLMPTGSAF